MTENTSSGNNPQSNKPDTLKLTRASILQLSAGIVLFILSGYFQRMLPNFINGILAQFQVLISVYLVTRIPKTGYYVAIALNTLSSINVVFLITIKGSVQAVTGTIIPLVTILIISLIAFSGKKLHTRNKEIEGQKNEIAKAKLEADNANRTKSEFLSSMSHEIRTPLNSIIGYIELLSLTDLDEIQRKHITTITTNAQNLMGIINEILDFSKIEQKKFILTAEPFNPVEAINKVVKLLSLRAVSKNISIKFIHDSPPSCIGDSLRFIQVITNLVGNSVKFTPADGSIRISLESETTEDGVSLSVSVADTGIGIPQDKLSRIFSPFEQSDPEITSKYGGTGLGLSISSYIVQSMGGTISVESTPGKGSRFYFTITLPEAEMSSETTHEPAPGKTHKLGTYNLHALVAEDTPDSLELIIAMLAKLGITADPSTNGEEAFDLFTRNKYDVVILDGFMPKMDGNETARKIRDLEKTNNIPRTPIIALSAKVLRSEVEEFLRSGIDTFVAKPVTFPALEEALKNAQRSLMPSAPVKSHAEVERRPFIAQISSFLGVSEDIVEKTMRKFAEMTLPEALQEIKNSMDPFDSERLVRAAHKLKGASLSLMLKEISDECATLEFLARNQLITEAKTTVDKIEQESLKLKEFLLSDNNFT